MLFRPGGLQLADGLDLPIYTHHGHIGNQRRRPIPKDSQGSGTPVTDPHTSIQCMVGRGDNVPNTGLKAALDDCFVPNFGDVHAPGWQHMARPGLSTQGLVGVRDLLPCVGSILCEEVPLCQWSDK